MKKLNEERYLTQKTTVVVFAWSINDMKFYESLLSDATVVYICGRLSAFLYARLKNMTALNLSSPFAMKKSVKKDSPDINELKKKIDWRFYMSRKGLDRVNISEIFFKIENFLSNINADLILMPGEFRLREQLVILAKPKKLPVVYWEAGPIGYVYFSTYGTNANSKISKLYSENSFKDRCIQHGVTQSKLESKTKPDDKIVQLIKIIEYVYVIIQVHIRGLEEFYEFLPARKKSIKLGASKKIHQIEEKQKYIIFYEQVDQDVNFSHFSPTLHSLKQTFMEWRSKFPDHILIIKPHPRNAKSEVTKVLKSAFEGKYKYHAMKQSVLSGKSSDHHHATINSNIIAELLTQGINVTVLGRSLYEGLPGVKRDIQEADIAPEIVRENVNKFLSSKLFEYDYRRKVWRDCLGVPSLLKELANAQHD